MCTDSRLTGRFIRLRIRETDPRRPTQLSCELSSRAAGQAMSDGWPADGRSVRRSDMRVPPARPGHNKNPNGNYCAAKGFTSNE